VKWRDVSDALPAFLTMVAMPLTFSISNGLAIGFVSCPIIKLFCGKGGEVHWIVYLLSILFVAGYLWV
jgi:AGZA family xanthine/uracil permease-like MFS transporter